MRELIELDQVAYVRFASVYKRFEDVQAFLDVIERLERDAPGDGDKRQISLLDSAGRHKGRHNTMNFSRFDHQCMARALRLARKGLYSTHPNPRVGCVIAQAEGVIGQGWHELAGGPHAEIMALRDAGTAAKGSTVYVTLEPCSHHGRTPPCAVALLEAGVSRVVIASADPNPAGQRSGPGSVEGGRCKSGNRPHGCRG